MTTRLIACLFLALTSTPLLAQSWYQVNLVVFENRSVVSGDEVLTQPQDAIFVAPENIVDVESIPEAGNEQGFQRTTISDQEFNNVLGALRRSSGYRVVLVKSWRQPGLERDQAIPVLVQGGDTFGSHYRLEGSVRLVLSRYLHLETDLWLGDYVQQIEAPQQWDLDAAPVIPMAPPPAEMTDAETPAVPDFVPTQLVRLQESRRMRSSELHYIDHPMLGVIAKVLPIENVPEDGDGGAEQ